MDWLKLFGIRLFDTLKYYYVFLCSAMDNMNEAQKRKQGRSNRRSASEVRRFGLKPDLL